MSLKIENPPEIEDKTVNVPFNRLLKYAVLMGVHRAGQKRKYLATLDREEGPALNGDIIDYFEWAAQANAPATLRILNMLFKHEDEVVQKNAPPINITVVVSDEDAD